jgi:aminomethyltransferase
MVDHGGSTIALPEKRMSLPAVLSKTPLHALHLELGAKMVPFAGYEMPVNYPGGIIAEHKHCRESAALFDVSHMGQVRLSGDHAAAALETLVPVDIAGLTVGKQRYGFFTNTSGGILDDLMITRREHDLLLIVNAACKAADITHLITNIGHRCTVQPLPDRALLALQGPRAVDALRRLNPEVATLTFMTGKSLPLAGTDCYVTRSGYTGEDGFEISVPAADAEALARSLLAMSEVRPVGLGARDTLRLEAGLCLYGHDINDKTTPVEAGLTWAIQKVRRAGGARHGGYPGAAVIDAQLATGPSNRRVGLLGTRPQAGPRDQRHARAVGEPAHRDGLSGQQPRPATPRGVRRGAWQAPAHARGAHAVRAAPLRARLNDALPLPLSRFL